MKPVLERKKEQLGMNPSTAYGRLKKSIMFEFAKRLNLDVCYQCGEPITDISEFTVEHKSPWFDSEDPPSVFFDLNNIAFSHHACNVGAGRKGTEAIRLGVIKAAEANSHVVREAGYVKCSACGKWLPSENFTKNRSKRYGISHDCRSCRSVSRSK